MEVDSDRLSKHVATLAHSPRPAQSAALAVARDYVAGHLSDSGWTVEAYSFSAFSEIGEPLSGTNLVARLPALAAAGLPKLIIGAHLDSVFDSPGADDNASGVAALLEIARLIPAPLPAHPKLELELVAFDLEEYGILGGAEHARRSRAKNLDLRGMVSLEMLGYCSHAPGSQALPRQVKGLYPEVGNFIGILGNQNSGKLLAEFRAGLTRVPQLPVESLEIPDNGNGLQATRLSDHSPFWDAGYAALMVTDTSFLRNPHYHQKSDTPDTLDMLFFTRVTQGCLEAARHLVIAGL